METICNQEKTSLGYRLENDRTTKNWRLVSPRGEFNGDLVYVWQIMNWEFEISNSEIRYALEEMKKNKHNVAEFGMFGSFMFTLKK